MLDKIKILFEDNNIIAVDKPAGILSYPLPGDKETTIGEIVNAKPAHRLDRDTSGVLLLAKNNKSLLALQKIFKERKIEKKYFTLVWGEIRPKNGEINIPLGRGSKDRLRVVPDGSGRDSRTIYEVVKYYPKENVSLCKIDLKTGRTHQIRVHFNAIGHSVVGDNKYSKYKSQLSRQFLHSYQLIFTHPFTNKKIIIKSPLPGELDNFLKKLS